MRVRAKEKKETTEEDFAVCNETIFQEDPYKLEIIAFVNNCKRL